MQGENLITLVYVSSAADGLTESDILGILRDSRKNNERDGISGMLLYKGGNFMQVLEGPAERVHATFARVSLDARHHGVLKLLEKTIEARTFDGWSMAFKSLNTAGESGESGYSPFLSSSLLDETFRLRPEATYKLLVSFKSNMR